MPCEIAVHPDRRLACFRFHGVISVSSGAQTFLDYVAHKDFDPGFTMLSDAREITRIEADFLSIFTKVVSLVSILRTFPAGSTSVILVGDETTFGYVRMLEQVLDHASSIRIIATWSEAEALTLAGQPQARLAGLMPSAAPGP